MALLDPSWRVKTRPCPFYQQGKCLFADSCNFLHTVSATVIPEAKASQASIPQDAAGPSTPLKPPRLVVDSPKSIRSPPRSPRTASLLYALRDVIGDPDDEDASLGSIIQPRAAHDDENTWSESLPTLVNEMGFGAYSRDDSRDVQGISEAQVDEDDNFEGDWTAMSDYDDDDQGAEAPQEDVDQPDAPFFDDADVNDAGSAEEIDIIQTSLAEERTGAQPLITESITRFSVASTRASSTTSGLLSPIELSTLNLAPLFHVNNANSFNASNASDTWRPPAPLLASPPRSPSISSTFDLLSSPFGSHSARVISPRLSAFMPRSPVSPARTISPAVHEEIEPLDLGLDSPSDYRNKQHRGDVLQDQDDEGAVVIDEDTLLSELSAEQPDASEENEEDEIEHDSYGHTSIWDNGDGPTAVFVGDSSRRLSSQVEQAVKRLSSTPTHFLSSSEPLFRDSEVAEDSTSIFEEPSPHVDEGSTIASNTVRPARHSSFDEDITSSSLAYLRSPTGSLPNENDTLTNLYDAYTDIQEDEASHHVRSTVLRSQTLESGSSSNPSTPASLRERVFTPPPVSRTRSETITADSPSSVASPMTSLDSVSRGRASPFSIADVKSPTRESERSSSGEGSESSRRVPFGFRNSFAMDATGRSSPSPSWKSDRSIPSSPLRERLENSDSALRTSPEEPSNTQIIKGLKPLRLSTILDAQHFSRPSVHSRMSSSSSHVNSFHQSGVPNRTSISSASVSSSHSTFDNRLLSSARSSLLPSHIRNSLIPSRTRSPSPLSPYFFKNLINLEEPRSAPPTSWRQSINYSRPTSRLSEPFLERDEEEEEDDTEQFSRYDPYGETIRRPITSLPHTAPVSPAPSVLHQYAIETPKPTLMFAIASDNVDEVRETLERGDVDPNEDVGPQSALAFALTNDKLSNKLDIVKTLLAYGADPAVAEGIKVPEPSHQAPGQDDPEETEPERSHPTRTLMDELDPATKYYLDRADAVHTRRISVLIQRSFFRPLTRVRYDLIGQDRALEQLFRVLSMHSRNLSVTPMVVLLCGPSGHGKSLLARKFGSLLDVPTHTVNMTTLRSTHDLWQSYSMSPYETPTTCTLAEFLINNEGKRCVVVLDEIEKTLDEKALWSLLMPWELGRCSFEAGSRHVDVKNVVWLGTSNIGHDLVFNHHESRKNPEAPMTREEYVELMALLRPKVSERLGASVLSRITTVLPFVPFSLEEKRAICSEALYTLGGDLARSLPSEEVETMINAALANYSAPEGARSLSRAISNQLVDLI